MNTIGDESERDALRDEVSAAFKIAVKEHGVETIEEKIPNTSNQDPEARVHSLRLTLRDKSIAAIFKIRT